MLMLLFDYLFYCFVSIFIIFTAAQDFMSIHDWLTIAGGNGMLLSVLAEKCCSFKTFLFSISITFFEYNLK